MTQRKYMREIGASLLLSRVSAGESDIRAASALFDEGIEWDIFVSFSVNHGTANIVYRNLLRTRGVPKKILETFVNIYNHTISCNIRMVSELDRIIDGLAGKGVDVITLKGPVTSEIIFGDIGLYPSGDIDILVKVKDLDSTRSHLETIGYHMTDSGFDEYREFYINELYHISFSNGRYVIEPHWNLFYRYFNAAPEFWWDDYVSVNSGGRVYNFLSPEKNILYNSFRLYSKAFSQLKFLVMVAGIIQHYGDEIDWERLFLYADRHRFEKVLRVAMKLSSDLLGTSVPAGCREIRGTFTKVLYKYICRMAIKGDNHHPLNKIVMALLKDDLSGALKVLLRRLFPSMGEIILRYRLPANSGMAVIYYILNPLLLVMGRQQKT